MTPGGASHPGRQGNSSDPSLRDAKPKGRNGTETPLTRRMVTTKE